MADILGKLKKIISDKKVMTAVITGLLGILLICFSAYSGEKGGKTVNEGDTEYKAKTEAEIKSLISKIDGVGDAVVSVYLQSSSRVVYKENCDTDSFGNKKSTVCFSGGEALTEKTLSPEIGGVLVICEGGGDINVVSKITYVLSSVYGVRENHIAVCELSD